MTFLKICHKSQKAKILEMLRMAANREVSCREFALAFLYHKVASRCSELRIEGFDIRFEPGPTTMDGKYTLVFDPELDTVKVKFDQVGQGTFLGGDAA